MNKKTRYLARYVVLPQGKVVEHGAVEVVGDRIVGVLENVNKNSPIDHHDAEATEVVDLGAVALMPGLVNAHSHAFQRDLRGRTEWLDPAREGEDFWSWREAMYALALGYDAPAFEEVTRRCFLEMLHSGITCVGEFHYVHHQPTGTPYPDPNELARRVMRAAEDVGIRLTLLRVAYHRAGHGAPATRAQRRFISPDPERYLLWHEQLSNSIGEEQSRLVKLGMAPHSIRAVPRHWLEKIGAHATAHALPLHIHACEQRAEIEQSIEEYGKRPLEVFEEAGLFEANTTLVHATHLSGEELAALTRNPRAQVCACPTTERNLGDGFLPATELLEHGVAISLGSDSHAEIDLWQEMRLVEYHERLQKERRNVLASTKIIETWKALGYTPPRTDRHEVAPLLWPMATRHGARSLGWDDLGELAEGKLADMITIDLDTPALWRLDRDSLLSHIAFAMHPGAVKDVFVGGQKII